ncbi:kinase-like domain-containing protein [Flagelloscypha sp. PMI_526]|nr:kinase-like domain-containing protein [Flagelloscypha sp. PMI_526]
MIKGELRLTPDHFVDSCRRFTHSDELADLNKSLAPWYRIEWCGLNDGTGEREAMEAIAIYSAKTVEVLPLHDQRWVFGVFSSETLRRCVTTGQGLDYSLIETMSLCEARSMMILLDYGLRMSDWSSKHQRRFHRLIKKIGLHFGQSVLPQTFYLQNIIREGDHPIAGGGYADIFRGSYGSQPVCLKRLRVFLSSDSQEILQEFLNEAIIWRHLRHPNVLPFLGINQTVFPGQTCFVSRFLANGNLAVFLKKNPNHDRLSLVAKGLQYLHSTHICHGDVKAANILIDENHQCYLADFGIAALISTKTATVGFATATRSTKGTMRWTAPELFSTPNTPASGIKAAPRDIYAFACTMLEVVTGKPPFSEMDDAPAMLAVIQGKRPPKPKSAHMTAELWQVIVRCWAQDPLERPKSNDIVTAFEHMISRGASHSS